MDRAAWRATVHGVAKRSDTTKRLMTQAGDRNSKLRGEKLVGATD